MYKIKKKIELTSASNFCEPGCLSRPSDCYEDVRSGDRFPVGLHIPHPSRPALRPTQPPKQWVLCLFRGYSGRDVALNTHPV